MPPHQAAARELAGAMRLVHAGSLAWVPPVVTMSGLSGEGVSELWDLVARRRGFLGAAGLAEKRARQQWELAGALVHDALIPYLEQSPAVAAARERLRGQVLGGAITAVSAADEILAAFDGA